MSDDRPAYDIGFVTGATVVARAGDVVELHITGSDGAVRMTLAEDMVLPFQGTAREATRAAGRDPTEGEL